MRKVLITESSLRGLLREMMDSPVSVNPVVDPQAAEVDPTNINFVPSNKSELMSALRSLVAPVDDDNVSRVYVALKDAIEKEEDEMKKDLAVETIVRNAIRKILKESFLNEALPVPPPPKMPVATKLASSSALDDEIKALVDSGKSKSDIISHLKTTKGLLKSKESVDDAIRRIDSLTDEKNARAVEDFLKKNEVKKLESMYKPWPVEEYRGPKKELASKASDFADSYLFKINFSKMSIDGVNFDLAGEAYKYAYSETMKEMSGAQPYEIVDSKQFKNNFKKYLVEDGIAKPPALDKVLQQIGIQSAKILGETIQSRIEDADDEIANNNEKIESSKSAVGLDRIKAAKLRQNISKANFTLEEVKEALGISVSMVKKVEVKALGKYVLGIKSEIFELIPDEPTP